MRLSKYKTQIKTQKTLQPEEVTNSIYIHDHSLDFSPIVVSQEASAAKFLSHAEPRDGFQDPDQANQKPIKLNLTC